MQNCKEVIVSMHIKGGGGGILRNLVLRGQLVLWTSKNHVNEGVQKIFKVTFFFVHVCMKGGGGVLDLEGKLSLHKVFFLSFIWIEHFVLFKHFGLTLIMYFWSKNHYKFLFKHVEIIRICHYCIDRNVFLFFYFPLLCLMYHTAYLQ